MLTTLKNWLSENWQWRSQIWRLSKFELVKKSRGTLLSWGWFVVKPAMYVFCFWFALEIGLRGARTGIPDGVPYIVWLAAGIIPWFFMQEMLTNGCDVLHKFSHLVKKIKFPLAAISTIFTGSQLLIALILQAFMLVIYFVFGMGADIYLLQIPLVLVIMFLFWNIFSIGFSQITAFSKDVANLLKTLSTPFFWLSGVIFPLKAVDIDWIQAVMNYNPVTFFCTVFRDAYCDKIWFWEDPALCTGFAIVFIVTLIFALFVYKRLNEEVSDVL
ncbi:MAG: ABC transporter permease [Coriobacteriia bacterium]|nr:ABC transporter permease [Coriobacteriia bacterium]